ncbi:MAG TPA: hypothetical protein VGL93_12675 [Streptosporangiaceae bacterium]|jgi:hypothetical protein
MRGKGINYDTGTHPAVHATRVAFEPDVVRREIGIIADDLHCTAVRITGDDPGRIALAGRCAAEAGLEVWVSPFLCDMTADEMRPVLGECARLAEGLRRGGAEVVLVTGAELSVFARGFLPGGDLFTRVGLLTSGRADLRDLLGAVPARLNAFLGEVTADARAVFGGRITYASLAFERVDWTAFDIVGVDAYRAKRNRDTYRDELRSYRAHGLPVAVTEFGCCTYRGAADQGGRGWMIVERGDDGPRRLDGDYVRDEAGQAGHLTDMLGVLDEEGVDSAFWFTFAGYPFPSAEGRKDLDLASYGVLKVTGRPGGAYPGLNLEPKESFHALAKVYGG